VIVYKQVKEKWQNLNVVVTVRHPG